MKQTLIQSLDHLVARWCTNRVISVSSQMTGSLARRFPAGKIATISNGIDLEAVRSDLTPQEARIRLGIPENCRVIGTAGRLEPVKRLDLFLKMARRLHDKDSSVRFLIAGEGREESRLKSLAEVLGLREHVLFLGHRDDAFDVLRALDVLVLSSDHEGLPMVLLEAMALGVVVVSRAVGGIPEVIRNGENGVLVTASDPAALADSCRRVLDDSTLAGQLANAARNRVSADFSAERNAREVRHLYNVLLGIA